MTSVLRRKGESTGRRGEGDVKAGGAVGRDWRDTATIPRSWKGQDGTSLRASGGSAAPPHTLDFRPVR